MLQDAGQVMEGTISKRRGVFILNRLITTAHTEHTMLDNMLMFVD